MAVKKQHRLYQLHEGQEFWLRQEIKLCDDTTPTAFVRFIFSLGMRAYMDMKKREKTDGVQ